MKNYSFCEKSKSIIEDSRYISRYIEFGYSFQTFLSPIVKISKEEEEAKEEYFHSFLSQKINYYYIFAIIFLTVLLVDAKPRTFRLVKDLFSRMNESEYEVMQLKQTTV